MLKNALLKKSKGEELTEEEKILLEQYDELNQENVSRIALLEKEKELNIQKFATANDELQEKLKELANVSSELETTRSEKETFMKLLDDEKSSAKIKEELAKLEAEKKLKEKAKKKEEETQAELTKYETSLKTLTEEMEKIKKENNIFKFKYDVSRKKIEFPYLEKEIDKILGEVESKGIDLSTQILEFLINSKNHDEEMKKYQANKKKGSSIFEEVSKTVKKEEKIEEIDPKYAKFKGLNIDLLKEYGFINRR